MRADGGGEAELVELASGQGGRGKRGFILSQLCGKEKEKKA